VCVCGVSVCVCGVCGVWCVWCVVCVVCVCGNVRVSERNFKSRVLLSLELVAYVYRFSTSYQQTPLFAVSVTVILPVQRPIKAFQTPAHRGTQKSDKFKNFLKETQI